MEKQQEPRGGKKESKAGVIIGIAATLAVLGAMTLFALYRMGIIRLPQPAPEQTTVEIGAENGTSTDAQGRPAIPDRDGTLYVARLDVDASERMLYGRQRITYVNSAGETLYGLRFHLYPNTVLPGCMMVREVSLNGCSGYFTVTGDNGDVLSVPLAVELEHGEHCNVFIRFDLDIERYGRNGSKWLLERAMPVAAVYENEWLVDAAPDDVAYSQAGEYRVAVNTDRFAQSPGCEAEETPAGRYFTAPAAPWFDLAIE